MQRRTGLTLLHPVRVSVACRRLGEYPVLRQRCTLAVGLLIWGAEVGRRKDHCHLLHKHLFAVSK